MHGKARKILSLVLSFGLLFQQLSFAQVAFDLRIADHLSMMRSSLITEKFRPAQLRYFSYDHLNDNFKVLLDKGDFTGGQSPAGTVPEKSRQMRGLSPKVTVPDELLKAETKTLLNYFLIGIALQDSAFWVNLRPDSQDQIIDPNLGMTDIGKIMLEADLQLKKDTSSFTSPQTAEGREYWDKLYKKAEELYGNENITIPTLTRPWIVPGEIIVRESKESAYVYKANLKVMLEQDYLKDSTQYSFKDERSKALNEYSSQLIRELIIPKLTREVNSSKRYAPLRQVYYSLVLSRWFKLRFKGQSGSYPSLIDTNNISNLTSQQTWSKTDYFQQYKKSFAQGEYNVKEPVSTPTGQVIRSYFSGGIKLDKFASSAVIFQKGISNTLINQENIVSMDSSAAVDPTLRINLLPEGKGASVSSAIMSEEEVHRFIGLLEIEVNDLSVEEEAVKALGSIKDERNIGILKNELSNNKNYMVRTSIARILGVIGNEYAVDALMEAITTRSFENNLSWFQKKEGKWALTEGKRMQTIVPGSAIDDRPANVLWWIISALEETKSKKAVNLLTEIASGESIYTYNLPKDYKSIGFTHDRSVMNAAEGALKSINSSKGLVASSAINLDDPFLFLDVSQKAKSITGLLVNTRELEALRKKVKNKINRRELPSFDIDHIISEWFMKSVVEEFLNGLNRSPEVKEASKIIGIITNDLNSPSIRSFGKEEAKGISKRTTQDYIKDKLDGLPGVILNKFSKEEIHDDLQGILLRPAELILHNSQSPFLKIANWEKVLIFESLAAYFRLGYRAINRNSLAIAEAYNEALRSLGLSSEKGIGNHQFKPATRNKLTVILNKHFLSKLENIGPKRQIEIILATQIIADSLSDLAASSISEIAEGENPAQKADEAGSPVKSTQQKPRVWKDFDKIMNVGTTTLIKVTADGAKEIPVIKVGSTAKTEYDNTGNSLFKASNYINYYVSLGIENKKHGQVTFSIVSFPGGDVRMLAITDEKDPDQDKAVKIDLEKALKALSITVFDAQKKIVMEVTKEWFDYWKKYAQEKGIDTKILTNSRYTIEIKAASSAIDLDDLQLELDSLGKAEKIAGFLGDLKDKDLVNKIFHAVTNNAQKWENKDTLFIELAVLPIVKTFESRLGRSPLVNEVLRVFGSVDLRRLERIGEATEKKNAYRYVGIFEEMQSQADYFISLKIINLANSVNKEFKALGIEGRLSDPLLRYLNDAAGKTRFDSDFKSSSKDFIDAVNALAEYFKHNYTIKYLESARWDIDSALYKDLSRRNNILPVEKMSRERYGKIIDILLGPVIRDLNNSPFYKAVPQRYGEYNYKEVKEAVGIIAETIKDLTRISSSSINSVEGITPIAIKQQMGQYVPFTAEELANKSGIADIEAVKKALETLWLGSDNIDKIRLKQGEERYSYLYSPISVAVQIGPDAKPEDVFDAPRVVINHSETREFLGATAERARDQLKVFLDAGFKVILAFGDFPVKLGDVDYLASGLRKFPVDKNGLKQLHLNNPTDKELNSFYDQEVSYIINNSIEEIRKRYAEVIEALEISPGVSQSDIGDKLIYELSTKAEIEHEIKIIFKDLKPEDMLHRIDMAYEPVEGIKTVAISPKLAEFRLKYIRKAIAKVTGVDENKLEIIYGGGGNVKNIGNLGKAGYKGAFIGRASALAVADEGKDSTSNISKSAQDSGKKLVTIYNSKSAVTSLPNEYLGAYGMKGIDPEEGVKIIHAVSRLDYRAWQSALSGQDVSGLFVDASKGEASKEITIIAGETEATQPIGAFTAHHPAEFLRKAGVTQAIIDPAKPYAVAQVKNFLSVGITPVILTSHDEETINAFKQKIVSEDFNKIQFREPGQINITSINDVRETYALSASSGIDSNNRSKKGLFEETYKEMEANYLVGPDALDPQGVWMQLLRSIGEHRYDSKNINLLVFYFIEPLSTEFMSTLFRRPKPAEVYAFVNEIKDRVPSKVWLIRDYMKEAAKKFIKDKLSLLPGSVKAKFDEAKIDVGLQKSFLHLLDKLFVDNNKSELHFSNLERMLVIKLLSEYFEMGYAKRDESRNPLSDAFNQAILNPELEFKTVILEEPLNVYKFIRLEHFLNNEFFTEGFNYNLFDEELKKAIMIIGDSLNNIAPSTASSAIKVSEKKVQSWKNFEELKPGNKIQITIRPSGVNEKTSAVVVDFQRTHFFLPNKFNLNQGVPHDIYTIGIMPEQGSKGKITFVLRKDIFNIYPLGAFKGDEVINADYAKNIDVDKAISKLSFKVFDKEKRIEMSVSKEWFDYWQALKEKGSIKDTLIKTIGGYTIVIVPAASSSPVSDNLGISASSAIDNSDDVKASSSIDKPDRTGGIDFRALPMSIQPMGSFTGLNFQLPQLSPADLARIDINTELTQIENMVKSGISPSGSRIKELVAACVQKGQISQYADSLLLDLIEICKMEEENAYESSPELREALVIVDSAQQG